MSSSPHHRHNQSSPFPYFPPPTSDRDTAAPQQQSLPQGMFLLLHTSEAALSSDVKRNKSDSSSSSIASKRVNMQKLTKKNEKKEPNRSASMPTAPLKSAMKPPRTTLDRIPNNDPLPDDKELLTGHLNHTTSQLQHLADRAERLNEWIDMDTIVYNRLKTTAETPTTILSVPTPKSTNFNIPQLAPSITVDAHVTAQMIELQERIAVAKGWLKELERSVYWQREEYRRTEKAMGRKKSGQSGGVGDAARKIVTYGSEIGGQHDEGSAVATGGSGLEFAGPSGRAAGEEFGGPSGFARGLGGFSGPGGFGGASGLVGGQSGLVGGSGLFDGLEFTGDVDEDALSARLAAMDASIMREQAEGQGQGDVLRQKDYARERWSSGKQSRLPTQDEWEQMFGKGALRK